MSDNYSKYLLLMVLVVIGAVVAGMVLMIRSRKPEARAVKCVPVDFGSVSIFFDKYCNATIIPYVADLFGEGKATVDVTELPQPYNTGSLGAAIRNSLASCRIGKPAGSAALMSRLRSEGWKTFSEGKTNLSVYYREGAGIVFNTTARTSEGAYIFNTRGLEHCLPAEADNEEIGRTALMLLKRCRC